MCATVSCTTPTVVTLIVGNPCSGGGEDIVVINNGHNNMGMNMDEKHMDGRRHQRKRDKFGQCRLGLMAKQRCRDVVTATMVRWGMTEQRR